MVYLRFCFVHVGLELQWCSYDARMLAGFHMGAFQKECRQMLKKPSSPILVCSHSYK